MRRWVFDAFGLDRLRVEDAAPEPAAPGPGEALLRVGAASLNYRDLMIVEGTYNPRLRLPQTPLADGAGVIEAVGPDIAEFRPGDRVLTHPVVGWEDGRFRREFAAATLGGPGPGMAGERVLVPARALVRAPEGWTHAEASTLPIAALTAWSALVSEGGLQAGRTVLVLGTGGVAIFALQMAKALGATVLITSSSEEKLERARELGADVGIHRIERPDWDEEVRKATDGTGVDVVVECGGAGTLNRSIRATAAGGVVALLGALSGLDAKVALAPVLMRRIRIAGVMTDCRRALRDAVEFLAARDLRPVIDSTFPFEALPEALLRMKRGAHFGKIVLGVVKDVGDSA